MGFLFSIHLHLAHESQLHTYSVDWPKGLKVPWSRFSMPGHLATQSVEYGTLNPRDVGSFPMLDINLLGEAAYLFPGYPDF